MLVDLHDVLHGNHPVNQRGVGLCHLGESLDAIERDFVVVAVERLELAQATIARQCVAESLDPCVAELVAAHVEQHEEDDAPAMHEDSASEHGFEPLGSYSADDHESEDDGESE